MGLSFYGYGFRLHDDASFELHTPNKLRLKSMAYQMDMMLLATDG